MRRLGYALAVASITVVAGCGGSETPAKTTPSGAPQGAAPSGDARAKIEACLKKNGASLPKPGEGGGPGQGPAGGGISQEAFKACQKYFPQGGPGGGGMPPQGAPSGTP